MKGNTKDQQAKLCQVGWKGQAVRISAAIKHSVAHRHDQGEKLLPTPYTTTTTPRLENAASAAELEVDGNK